MRLFDYEIFLLVIDQPWYQLTKVIYSEEYTCSDTLQKSYHSSDFS